MCLLDLLCKLITVRKIISKKNAGLYIMSPVQGGGDNNN